nr:sugar ABC transporter permease [uncultured Sphaerochaeta sp.]
MEKKRFGNIHLTALLFILPAFLVYTLYTASSIFRTFQFSLYDWSGFGPVSNSANIGLANYAKLFGDERFLHAIRNNFILVIVSIVFQLSTGMILALIINTKHKGVKFFRTIYPMPLLLSTVAIGILWLLMLNPYTGLFNGILRIISPDVRLSWLGSEDVVLFAVMFVICWQYSPQYMILLRAGMTNISGEVYEAAVIDGANRWQQFWKITFPLLSGTLKTSAVLSIVGSLKYFDLIWVMTGGGPNGYSELMATYMYRKAFTEDQMGYASSVASSMVIISLVVIILVQFMLKKKDDQ